MVNCIMITSVINTPNKCLSYSKTRSVFSREERFSQTKKTIESIRSKLPNDKIFLVECTQFNEEEKLFFNENCDYIHNIWEIKNLHDNIFGISKSLGEGTMTIQGLEYIKKQNLSFDYIYKISGRYFLNDNFSMDGINQSVFKYISDNKNNVFTGLYKLNFKIVDDFINFLKNNIHLMKQCIGYEVIISKFVNNINFFEQNVVGLSGYVTVCGSKYEG